jgi:hypothetical protein
VRLFSDYGTSTSWRHSCGSYELHVYLSCYAQPQIHAAPMISSSMAGARLPLSITTAFRNSSASLHAPSRTRSLLSPLCSRASCSWTRNDVAQSRRRGSLVSPQYKRCTRSPATLFSTSTPRRLKVEDDKNDLLASQNNTQVCFYSL